MGTWSFEEFCTTGSSNYLNTKSNSEADLFKGSYPSGVEIRYNRTMEREGKILTTYTGGTEFKAFFRIKEDNENQKETIVIYYDVTAPVRPGTLIMYGYGVFLVLNRETVENDLYFKSTLVKCNGVYNEIDGYFGNIPFYSDNMLSSVAVGNSIITTLNGNVELLTEENSLSKKIAINQYFNEFGRTFRVCNLYSMDGILHIIATVEANRDATIRYSVELDGVPETILKINDTVQLSATAYTNASITTGATFDWISSNNDIAIVDGTGLVTCLTEGVATITCTWVEKDVSNTATISISNTDTETTIYNYYISGNTSLKNGFSRTYTFSVTDNAGNSVDDIICTWNVIASFSVEQTISNNTIKLSIDNEDLIGTTFTLQALVNDNVVTQVEISIVEEF